MTTAPLPALPEVDWSQLSPAAAEIAMEIGFRLVAGYSLDEIARLLTANEVVFKHCPPPRDGVFTKPWVAARWKELRRECAGQWAGSASTSSTAAPA